MWLLLAFCIFVFISFFGIGGFVGSIFSDICFGIFGVAAWAFPLLLFLACAFWISNQGSRLASIKFGSCVLLYFCICCFAALFEGEYGGVYHIGKLYARCATGKQGGGVIGGTVCYVLAPALGKVGTGVLLGVFALIALVLITQKSLLGGMKSRGGSLWHSAKESTKRRREERRESAALRQEERRESARERQEADREAAADYYTDEYQDEGREPAAKRLEEHERHREWERSEVVWGGRTKKASRLEEPVEVRETEHETMPFYPIHESAIRPAAAEYTSVSRKASKADAARSASSAKPAEKDRQLDVSVMFYPQTETKRKRRHASGVTLNTKITGGRQEDQAGMSEILPESYEPEEETCYIDLEQADPGRTDEASPSGTGPETIYPDMGALHIEGEGLSEPEFPRLETAGRQSSQSGDALRDRGSFAGRKSAGAAGKVRIMTGISEEDEDAPDLTAGEEFIGGQTYQGQRDYPEPEVSKSQRKNPDAGETRSQREYPDTGEPRSQQKYPDAGELRSQRGYPEAGEYSEPGESQEQQADPEQPGQPAQSSTRIKRNPRSSEQEIAEGIASVEAEAAEAAKAAPPEYIFPPLELLKKGTSKSKKGQEQEIRQTAAKLQQTLNSFGVHATVTNVSCGPSVTRYELLPEQGVKVSKIVSLSDDIKLNLAAADIRIEAPIPGKSAVGIEVPNAENGTVPLRDLLESEEFQNHKSKLAFATGKDIGGKVVVSDIAKMPHLLIAGATGSGKSVCINTLIMSILYKAKPDEVKLIMIDPKVVELSVYNGIPHLLIPVVTDPKKAAGALNWGVAEMTDRYAKFAEVGVRDLKGYNQKIEALENVDDPDKPQKLPQIVIIVDELADLMMVAPGDVEDAICRLAQLARACGIHLIIATQRPSVNVITGLIKANMPSRIAFSVSSGVDSRTIIDMYGAEKLLGKGDMLFYPQGYQKPARVQGAFVSDEEVSDVVDFLKENNSAFPVDTNMEEKIAKAQSSSAAARNGSDTDELFTDAGKFIIEKDKASIGMLQRVFKIGFNRAARIMDQLSEAGVVGPEEGTKPRKILMSMEQFENYLEQN
ncbi:MAG: DNA translocase FtsK 4TM domain-containing protein [Lachnospiraceae bacterium]|nr:DNA translocase FtsK 4TM domain-containing protein [Lachnospiraceae bacterium]